MVFWKRPALSNQDAEVSSLEDGGARKIGYSGSEFQSLPCAINEGTAVQGRLNFDVPVRLEGQLNGDVSSTKTLVLGPSGLITGPVIAKTLVIFGTVRGNIEGVDSVELRAGAKVEGNVTTPHLSMQEGSVLDGQVHMPATKSLAIANSSVVRRSAVSASARFALAGAVTA